MKRLSRSQVIENLQEMDFPPLSITSSAGEPELPIGEFPSNYRPDLLVDVGWQGKNFIFVAKVETVSTPKNIDQVIWQMNAYLKSLKQTSNKNFHALIVAPYFSERILAELMANGISGIDLSGNIRLVVPGELLFSKTGQPNKFPSNNAIKNVFRGTSAIVARVLLSRPQYNGVNEVLFELKERGGETSLGTVSKVLRVLEDDLIISRSHGVSLTDPARLLDNLRDNYRAPQAVEKIVGKVTDVDATLAKIVENCNQHKLLCAIDEKRRYAVSPTAGVPTRIYVEDIKKALDKIEFDQGARFANIELLKISDRSLYFDRRWEPNERVFYASPLQIYLDLATGGKREQDAAEQIAKDLLTTQMPKAEK
jgi:hypothetical protein